MHLGLVELSCHSKCKRQYNTTIIALRILTSLIILRLLTWAYRSLQHTAIGHTKHPNEQRISSWPFAVKKLSGANRQDSVFIRPPGISHGAFELRMDNVWFCKILLLFEIESKTALVA
jgi:hypothetical protein